VVLQRTQQLSILVILAVLVTSIGPFYFFVFVYDTESFSDMNVSWGSWSFIHRQPLFQLVLLVNIFWICSTEFLVQLMRRELRPTVVDYFKELVDQSLDLNRESFVNANKEGWVPKRSFNKRYSHAFVKQATIKDYDNEFSPLRKTPARFPSENIFIKTSIQIGRDQNGESMKQSKLEVNPFSLVKVEELNPENSTDRENVIIKKGSLEGSQKGSGGRMMINE
jgi:hypothetical protein